MIYWPAKAPGEVEDFAFDFAAVLQPGETISSRTVTVSGVTKNSDAVAGALVTVWLSGGTPGAPGIVTCAITTSSGRTYAETGIVPIGEEPVSLAMAKAQLRADAAGDDALILELIQSAREYAEAYCGIRLMPAAVQMGFACFAGLERLGQAPVQAVTAINYLDAAGASQLLDPATYELVNVDSDALRPRIRLAFAKSWPATRSAEDAVKVSATVGYAVAPKPVIRAMLLLLTHWYDNRQAMGQNVAEIPHAVTALLANYRR